MTAEKEKMKVATTADILAEDIERYNDECINNYKKFLAKEWISKDDVVLLVSHQKEKFCVSERMEQKIKACDCWTCKILKEVFMRGKK